MRICILVLAAWIAAAAPLQGVQDYPDAESPAGRNLPATDVAWLPNACAEAGRRLEGDIDRESRGPFTLLVFLDSTTGTGVCHRNRDYGVVGDPIHVAVFTHRPGDWSPVAATFEPCSLESDAPTILIREGVTPPRIAFSAVRTARSYVRRYLPRTCFNTSVSVTVGGQQASLPVARATIEQAQRYRATIQLGFGLSDLRQPTFGLRSVDGGSAIYARGPADRGPEYFASLLIYGLPRSLASLVGGERYLGRDVIHDDDFLDRIGGVIGVGLPDPGDRFILGLAFELAPGINAIGTWEYAKVRTLAADLAEGSLFAGVEEDIPTRLSWESGFALGLSVDLLYTARLFSR